MNRGERGEIWYCHMPMAITSRHDPRLQCERSVIGSTQQPAVAPTAHGLVANHVRVMAILRNATGVRALAHNHSSQHNTCFHNTLSLASLRIFECIPTAAHTAVCMLFRFAQCIYSRNSQPSIPKPPSVPPASK